MCGCACSCVLQSHKLPPYLPNALQLTLCCRLWISNQLPMSNFTWAALQATDSCHETLVEKTEPNLNINKKVYSKCQDRTLHLTKFVNQKYCEIVKVPGLLLHSRTASGCSNEQFTNTCSYQPWWQFGYRNIPLLLILTLLDISSISSYFLK